MNQDRTKLQPLLMGIDIGFGDVKIAAYGMNGGNAPVYKIGKFQTAIAEMICCGAMGLENEQRYYSYGNRHFKVGDEAISSDSVCAPQNIDKMLENVPLLIFKALEVTGAAYKKDIAELLNEPKMVCVGLPIGFFASHKMRLMKALQSFAISGYQINLENRVRVRAQGQGVQLDFLYNYGRQKEEYFSESMVVMDIGYNTVDILCVDKGRPSAEYSTMLEGSGVRKICNWLRKHEDTRALKLEQLTDAVIKEALKKGEIEREGIKHDLKPAIEKITRVYVSQLLSEVESQVKGFMARASKLIVAGGGAYYIQNALRRQYQNNSAYLHIMETPEYSNARGFLADLVEGR